MSNIKEKKEVNFFLELSEIRFTFS